MNTRILVLLLIFSGLATGGYAQEKSKKQIKEEAKIEKQKQTEVLLNSRTFVFIARTVLPQGYKTINLTSGTYTIKFSPDNIISYMPFYGNAYNGVGYGGQTGMKFEGKPEEFTVEKGKKNYSVNAVVKGENDTYRISIFVGFGGSASLSINSNNRSMISYNGEVTAPKSLQNK